MTKQSVIAAILAAIPSYFSLFFTPTGAGFCLVLTTVFGFLGTAVTGSVDGNKSPLMDHFRTGWIIHLIGSVAVFTYHNL